MEQYSFAEIDSYISEFKMSEAIKKYLITGELPKKKQTPSFPSGIAELTRSPTPNGSGSLQTPMANNSGSINNNNNINRYYLYDYEQTPLTSFGNYDKNLHNTDSFDIANSIEKCKQLEKHIKQCELDENIDNQCPVCFIPISSANYVLPTCGHKMCVSCFIGNVKYNKHTGDCCAMCRKKYIST